jgi:hypothetical protein
VGQPLEIRTKEWCEICEIMPFRPLTIPLSLVRRPDDHRGPLGRLSVKHNVADDD